MSRAFLNDALKQYQYSPSLTTTGWSFSGSLWIDAGEPEELILSRISVVKINEVI